MKQIHIYSFSPTGKTALVADIIARRLASRLALPVVWSDYTLPHQRTVIPKIADDDLILWASPVYAGKTPNLMLPFVRKVMKGNGNPAIVVATYGNRSFDNALAEMVSVVRKGGMRPVAAASVVTQHSFAPALGEGRPDANDRGEIEMFADAIELNDELKFVPGDADAPYYQPLKTDLTPARFLKALPVVNDRDCIGCRRCVKVCPMGSVSFTDHTAFSAPCIKCMACVNTCPGMAISMTDPDFLSHGEMLLRDFSSPNENIFIV